MTNKVTLGTTRVKLLIRLNLLAALLHLVLAIVTGVLGNLNLRPPIYTTKNTFVYNSSSTGFELIPRFEKTGGFPVTALTVAFFTITSFFHLSNIIAWPKVYFGYLERCQTPSRWAEYLITASIMASVLSFLTGQRDAMMIANTTGLISTTMLFGYLSERFNRPRNGGDAWETSSFFERSIPHFCGYVPYIFAWTAILYSFFGGGGTCAAPKWVWAIIIAQLVLFSLFIFPQLYQLYNPPKKFVRGEVAFIILSFVSKAVLGIILLVGGLTKENFDAFDNLDRNTTNCDIVDIA